MWQPLTTLSEEDYLHIASLSVGGSTQSLVDTLRMVAIRPYADRLFVVIQMGHLALTTATTWDDDLRCRWSHPQIPIYLRSDALISVSYSSGNESDSEVTASKLLKSPHEAAQYIDILMNRMLYDAENATAAERKK